MQKTGLILTGGGARAAYQVGVLKAISDQFPDLHHPFNVVCGTSAGAINAIAVAGGEDVFRHNIGHLEHLWSQIKVEDIYRADAIGMTRWVMAFARSLIQGKTGGGLASLLDNRPLREFLAQELPINGIADAIAENRLDAIGINACGYSAGQNLCFFQAKDGIESWNLGQRAGCRTTLGLDHVMASSAIPTVFPPVKINREYFGDGVTRQMAHVSPAIHLGAQRILVIGVSANRMCVPHRRQATASPSIPEVMEHVLNGMFLDTMDYDVERLLLINQLVDMIPEATMAASGLALKPLHLLDISPSEPINEIAARYLDGLPSLVRRIIGREDPNGEGGSSLASYLLFDARFCRELITLGYKDAQAHSQQLNKFFAE